jgi:hypothetical protein
MSPMVCSFQTILTTSLWRRFRKIKWDGTHPICLGQGVRSVTMTKNRDGVASFVIESEPIRILDLSPR